MTTPQNAEHTMGSPKRKKHETYDLNPSPAAQTKLQKTIPENAECTIGSPKKRKHET